MCGLTLAPWGREGAALEGDRISYSRRAREVRQHGLIAHELGHWTLGWAGEEDTEQGARYLAGALMLPRSVFDRDLRRTWDIEHLRAKHLNASAEMTAIRVVQLRDAAVAIFDQGKLTGRFVSPWIVDRRIDRVSRYERELAQRALEAGETIRDDDLCASTPVFDGHHRRVIVLCEYRQLALRL